VGSTQRLRRFKQAVELGSAASVDRREPTTQVRSLLTRALDQIEGPGAPTKRGGR
jgi:hypothetical protein